MATEAKDPMCTPAVGSVNKKDQDKGPFNTDAVKQYGKRKTKRTSARGGRR